MIEKKNATILNVVFALIMIAIGVCTTGALASEPQWWPSVRTIPATASLGLGASPTGGFLLVDSGSGASEHTLYCDPNGRSSVETYPTAYIYNEVGLRNVVPGSPSFAPDGSSLIVSLQGEGQISKPTFASEGSAEAPEQLGTVGVKKELFTSNLGGPRFLVVATGSSGDTAVAEDLTYGTVGLATRAPGESWTRQQVEGFTGSLAVAVDGLGNVVLLGKDNQMSPPAGATNAYFEHRGAHLEPLAVPGSYFTAVAASTQGAEAIAGYTPSGPAGAGLYLSRRESAGQPFGAPVLVSNTSDEQIPQLAYDANGTLTVAWTEGNDIEVASAAASAPLSAPQSISTAGGLSASDEQLAVAPSGEAVLTWAAGPHERREHYPPGDGLWGTPTSLYASLRSSAAGQFASPRLLTTSARYNEGVNPTAQGLEGVRVTDAIAAGRVLVAWGTNTPQGPYVEVARYASVPGCAVPVATVPQPARRPRVRWRAHPGRGRHMLVLGTVTCPTACRVVAQVRAVADHDKLAARQQLHLRAGASHALSLSLTGLDRRLARSGRRVAIRANVTIYVAGKPTIRLQRRSKAKL